METQRQRFRLEFEKYRGFLAQEEQLQLRRLEEEERATLSRLRDSKGHLSQRGRALRELIQELEEQSQRPALGLLEVRPCHGGMREKRVRNPVSAMSLSSCPQELAYQ